MFESDTTALSASRAVARSTLRSSIFLAFRMMSPDSAIKITRCPLSTAAARSGTSENNGMSIRGDRDSVSRCQAALSVTTMARY
ncbi:hypothetical protein ACFPRL_04855 [Pseudoclavibacter helvolus]